MSLPLPRRALLAGLALAAASTALPGAGSARPLPQPDGPDCSDSAAIGVPNDTSLAYIMKHGVRFSFRCSGYRKDGGRYTYSPAGTAEEGEGFEGFEGTEEAGARAAADAPSEADPDTGWPAGSTYTVKAQITMPSGVRRALGLSSRVAAAQISGPKSYDDLEANERINVWTLTLKPAFKAALKRKKVAYISLDYTLDVTLPAFTGTGRDSSGHKRTIEIPESTAHFSNTSDFKFLTASKWTPKCKTAGQDLATGCPGAP